MKRSLSKIAIAAAIGVLSGIGVAQANNTITLTVKNNTGETLIRQAANSSCNPTGTCTQPGSINNGASGVMISSTTDSANSRTVSNRYVYYVGSGKRSCQISGTALGGGLSNPGAACTGFTPRSIATDGNGVSPKCGTFVITHSDPATCTFAAEVTITN